jgi:hypothetical protein
MEAELKRKSKTVFDLHFVHGPRHVVALTEEGRRFIRIFPLDDSQVYNTAIKCGLQVSFEDAALRDQITKVQSMHD